jgi:hypothetical protein
MGKRRDSLKKWDSLEKDGIHSFLFSSGFYIKCFILCSSVEKVANAVKWEMAGFAQKRWDSLFAQNDVEWGSLFRPKSLDHLGPI